jgi:hypothetical protein
VGYLGGNLGLIDNRLHGEKLQHLNAERFQVIYTYYSVINWICYKKEVAVSQGTIGSDHLAKIPGRRMQMPGFDRPLPAPSLSRCRRAANGAPAQKTTGTVSGE